MKGERTLYYSSFDDDFFGDGKGHILKEDYRFIKSDLFSKIMSAVIYTLALIFSNVYCRVFLHLKIVGAKKLRRHKGKVFIYANHTQPIGDVFNPALCAFPKRIYTVVSAANMDLKGIGKILYFLGALPIPSSIKKLKSFEDAVFKRAERHPIVIYPEAHLWEYYTKIRPFKDTSFKYPAKLNADVFVLTSTYQKSKFFKKPSLTLYVDGPYKSGCQNVKQRQSELCSLVSRKMTERSAQSNFEYIKYKKRESF
ncbi:MAG: hypothetical protein IJO86_03915 [Oscillospiraceae bacterium]|nr:hypothetical protein [Oscillospiraceae bacterium]